MNVIDISWTPRFWFRIEKPALELLKKLSQRHYDYVCRAASHVSDGYGLQNGFITIWLMNAEFPDSKMCCLPGELQTALKILEDSMVEGEEADLRQYLISYFHEARRKAESFAHIEKADDVVRALKIGANYVYDRGTVVEANDIVKAIRIVEGKP